VLVAPAHSQGRLLVFLEAAGSFDGSHVFHVAAGTVLIVLAAASMILRAVLYRKGTSGTSERKAT
jgi:hypothetical protein